MTVPVFLEIILNPDLLPVEQPSVLAHEWAHLGGYADESEANFIAWIACVRSGDPAAQYSAGSTPIDSASTPCPGRCGPRCRSLRRPPCRPGRDCCTLRADLTASSAPPPAGSMTHTSGPTESTRGLPTTRPSCS